MDKEGELLAGGNMGPVVRLGDVVRRAAGDWTPAVHRLLRHCRAAGLTGVPEVHGLTDDGHELLGFIAGDVPAYPMPDWVWGEQALVSSARLLRHLHAASADCDRGGPWRSPAHEPVEMICHNDVAPYNLVYRDGRAVGAIDVDFASPGLRLWDLGYLAYRIVPLSTDTSDGFTAGERDQRLQSLLQAYGTDATPPRFRALAAQRLLELADLSEQMAVGLNKPELRDHAGFYRQDAAGLT